MSDLQVMLRIRADGSGASGVIRNTKGELIDLGRAAEGAGNASAGAAGDVRELGRAAEGSGRQAGAAGHLWGEFGGLVRGVAWLEVARQVVTAGNALNGFNAALTAATGSQGQATEEMAFVRAESERLGISLVDAARAYTGLTAAARGTALEGQGARQVFSAIAEASRVMNLSAAETQGALTAVQQIISKGTVSAEELRGQLGERLPGVFQIAARAMGVTTAELGKMLEAGELTAEEFLPRFAAELQKTSAAGLEAARNSPAAEFQRLKNAVFELVGAVGQSGLLEGLGSLAGGLADVARDAALAVRALSSVRDGVPDLAEAEAQASGRRAQFAETSRVAAEAAQRLADTQTRSLAVVNNELTNNERALRRVLRVQGEESEIAQDLIARRRQLLAERERATRADGEATAAAQRANREYETRLQNTTFLRVEVERLNREVREAIKEHGAESQAVSTLVSQQERLKGMLEQRTRATRGSNDESREAARVARTWAESDRELANAKRPVWEAIQREQEARYQLADMLRDADRDLDNEIALAGLTGRARAELANEISAENFARQVNLASIQAGRPLAAEEIEFIRRNTEARLNARDAIEEATAAQERANAELARFADSYLSQATDAIGEFVAGGMRDWKDMWDSFKDIAKRAVADIVSQLLRQKIVVPIVAQLTGQGGAGGALGGIGNILGGLGSIFGGGAGGAAAGGGLGGILGGIGGLFGLGGGAFAGATAAGAAGVAGGAFSGAVASGTVGLGGALGGIASALGPIGLAIGAISLLRNVFGSNKPPDIRLGAVGQTRKPEVTFGTDLGQFQAGVRGGPDRDSIVRAVTEFDRGIAQIIGSIQGGSDQLNVIRDRLASWSVDLRGSAATAENVLGSRWQAILSTFPEDIQAIVRSAGDLQAQVQALGQVLAMPAQVQGILGDLRREFDLAGMSELERQTFLVNERFDALREQLTALRATQEQLAEVETFRTQALAALTSATDGAGNAIEDLTDQIRAYADFVAGFQAEAATAGLNEFQRELVGIQARLRENITRANELARAAGLQGAREEDLALIHQLAAQSAASAMSQLRDSARDLVDQLYSMTSTPPSVREYADFIAGFATEAANSALNDFQRQMVGIEAQMRANIARANDLARAAGLQGARERDLALIHQQAAAAAAVAMAQLRASGRSIVAQLYGDANAGAQQLTQPFTQAAAAASGSLSRITDELRQFADGLRLGDLSPLNQREQLAEAMRQLREASGAGDQQRVQQIARETLQIGRGLFATGSDYRELFNQVDAIVRATVPSATGGTGGGGGPVAEAARQVSAIERAQLAQQLAQITADSAAASGETFAQVAEDLGFTLEQLARDLGLDQDALGAYLESLQVDTASVAEEVTSAADRIVAAIREQAVAGLTNNAERARIATELAQITADLAQASGDSFAEVADALGFNLEQLARDLGLDQAALEAYLESLQIDAMSVADEIATAADRIVAAIREAATATPANPAAPGAPPGATPVAPTTPATPGPPPGATPLNPNSGGTPGEPIPVQPVEPPGGGIVGGELRRLGDLVERLLVERRNDQAATLALQGRVEQLTAQMADALAEVADGGGRIR